MPPAPSRTRSRRALTATATLAALLLLPAEGATAATTFPDPGGSGASVTLDRTTVAPGEWISIDGAGFVGTSGGSGVPLVTLRPYDFDRGPVWAADGPDHYAEPGTHTLEARTWFVTREPGGTFSGRMQLPPTAQVDGPPPGGLAGKHWLRVLSGAPFTSTGDRVTTPISYTVPFDVIERIRLGLTVQPGAPPGAPVPPPVHQAGTTFRPGAVVSVAGEDFTPGTTLTVELDGTDPLPGPVITTDAEGDVPDGTRVTLPDSTSVGDHTLRFSTGSVAHEVPIRVTPVPTRTLHTPAVRPGGTIAVSLKDYVGVRGTGQKVAVVIGSTVLACLTADGTGAAEGTAVIPASTAPGPVNLLLNAGTSCVPPPQGGVVDDLPISSLGPQPGGLTVAQDAPAVAVASGAQGEAVTVTGEGFAPGATATATFRGTAADARLTVDDAGRLTGTLTLPEAAGPGTLLVTAGTRTAAAAVTVAARPAPATPEGPTTTTPAAPTPTGPPPGGSIPTPTPAGPGLAPAPRPPAVAAGRVATLTAAKGGRTLRLVLRGGSRVRTTIVVRTRAKVRPAGRGRARVVTLARRTLAGPGTHALTLTRDGRALLRRSRTVRVVVTVIPKGGKPTTRTLVLRRR